MSSDKLKVGDVVYMNGRRGVVTSVSIGWHPEMYYVLFDGETNEYWKRRDELDETRFVFR